MALVGWNSAPRPTGRHAVEASQVPGRTIQHLLGVDLLRLDQARLGIGQQPLQAGQHPSRYLDGCRIRIAHMPARLGNAEAGAIPEELVTAAPQDDDAKVVSSLKNR